jgi:flavin-dependent dehydrogenase
MLPSATEPDYFNRHCAGENWVLVGDAAGHVDPISREGILYALWSGKLAAEAINDSKLKIYDSLWRENYGAYLKKRCQQKPTFYDPTVLNLAIRYHSLSGKLLA